MLRVNELFHTFQGEARWTGTPATFIRLQGCPVACPWCDTKNTWPAIAKRRIDIDAMLVKVEPEATWAEMTVQQVCSTVARLPPRHFVVTGGEPCAQPIFELTRELAAFGRVQIETSGAFEVNVWPDAWVTVSPKINMPGGYKVLGQAMDRADEIKMPVQSQTDIDALDALLSEHRPSRIARRDVWLQPVSQSEEATRLCMDTAMERDWRLSIQTHKFVGIR